MQSLSSALPSVLVDLPTLIEKAVQPYLVAGRAGKLTAAQAHELVEGAAIIQRSRELRALPLESVQPLLRHTYSRSVSWALFTCEYMSALVGLLQAVTGQPRPRVLEVCAGGGLLVEPMLNAGLEWRATDANPPSTAVGAVEACGALAAVQDAASNVEAEQISAVFFAWWSKSQPKKKRKHDQPGAADDHEHASSTLPVAEDRQLAEYCVARKIPVVFVSEPKGGLTGSPALWEGDAEGAYRIRPAAELLISFVDVPNWPGFQDRTWVIQPMPSQPAEG